MTDVRRFLRLQSDDFLTAMRDRVADQLLQNVRTTSVTLNGKGGGQDVHIPVATLADQLSEVLEERGLVPSTHSNQVRMTVARFA